MDSIKIEIKSSQIFEDYVDNVFEVHDAYLAYMDDGFKLIYDDVILYFDGESVCLKRDGMNLKIKLDVKTVSKIITPYGEIDIEIKGEKMSFYKSPFGFKIRYLISVGNTKGYINELEICMA